MKKLVLIGCALASSATAVAGKMDSGATLKPPRVADESDVYVELIHQGVKEGYGFKAEGKVVNFADGDRLRVDATQGGKVLHSTKCRVNAVSDGADYSEFTCSTTEKPIKAKGIVDFDLVYEDDKTDKDYLARRFSVNVQLWLGETWQVTGDDLLGVGYADGQARFSDTRDRTLRFRMWFAAKNLQAANSVLRCSVEGKQLPDFEASLQTEHEITADMITKGDKRTTWHWFLYQVEPKLLYVGPREGDLAKKDRPGRVTSDNPGKWSCQLRQGGRAIREIAFEVDAKGFLKPHALQAATGAVPLRKGVVQVDLKIPKDAAIDERIKPDQLKKSRGFGMPWPSDPGVKAIHAAFPAAYENQAPKYVKPKGKRLAGIAHDPPRFIDEASTEVQVQRDPGVDGKGYRFSVFAVVSGHTTSADRLRVDWRQGKKVVAVGKCEWNDGLVTRVTCNSTEPLKAKGAIEADLIYEDDDDGNEYLLRTYKLNVLNPKAFGDAIWLSPPDDALATAWMRPAASDDAELELFFWFTSEKYGELKMRCTVGGKQLPDIMVSPSQTPGRHVFEADVRPTQNGNVTEYYWNHIYAHTTILTGPKDKSTTLQTKDKVAWLADNPGAWDCMLRNDGKAFRQLLFTVSKDGYVEADPAQVDPAYPFLGKTVPVDVRFVKDSKLDTRIRGDAMKKSRGFGLPWPKAPTKPFPANSGLADPK